MNENEKKEFEERPLYINRVAKVKAGGKRFSFQAVVAVGDLSGHVGVGLGKANEVVDAISKAIEKAKKNLISVPIKNNTIPFPVKSKYCSTTVILRPAPSGTGVIAGGAVRAIMELAGVKDVVTKVVGSTNIHNVTKATIDAIELMNKIEKNYANRRKVISK
jgi:small subunit ribosomal protein S5